MDQNHQNYQMDEQDEMDEIVTTIIKSRMDGKEDYVIDEELHAKFDNLYFLKCYIIDRVLSTKMGQPYFPKTHYWRAAYNYPK